MRGVACGAGAAGLRVAVAAERAAAWGGVH